MNGFCSINKAATTAAKQNGWYKLEPCKRSFDRNVLRYEEGIGGVEGGREGGHVEEAS